MKSYTGKPGDVCCFYRCKYCDFSSLIEDEKTLHESRCDAVNQVQAQEIMRKLPNIEQECC